MAGPNEVSRLTRVCQGREGERREDWRVLGSAGGPRPLLARRLPVLALVQRLHLGGNLRLHPGRLLPHTGQLRL
jgi:hypothetical protein